MLRGNELTRAKRKLGILEELRNNSKRRDERDALDRKIKVLYKQVHGVDKPVEMELVVVKGTKEKVYREKKEPIVRGRYKMHGFDPVNIKVVVEMLNDGRGYEEIGALYGRSYQGMQKIVYKETKKVYSIKGNEEIERIELERQAGSKRIYELPTAFVKEEGEGIEEEVNEHLIQSLANMQSMGEELYLEAIKLGVSREQARMFLVPHRLKKRDGE